MKTILKAAIAASAFLSVTAQAAITVTIRQNGPDLVVSATGTLNPAICSPAAPGFLATSAPHLVTGPAAGLFFANSGGTLSFCEATPITPAQTGFGTLNNLVASSVSGAAWDFELNEFSATGFYGPPGWAADTDLSATMTFAGATLADVGLTVGTTLVYTLSGNGTSDTITLNVAAPPAPVPTLGSYAIAGLALLMAASGYLFLRARRAGAQG